MGDVASEPTIAATTTSLAHEERRDFGFETRWVESNQPIAEDAGFDRPGLAALMVDHHPPVRVEDEIVLDARQREITVELDAVVVRRRAWRQDLDHDDRIGNLDRVKRRRWADDEGVRFKGGARANPDGHAVGIHAAWQSGAGDRRVDRLLSRKFRQRMRRALRRHQNRLAIAQLPAAFAFLGPDEELLDTHFAIGDTRHAPFLPRETRVAKQAGGPV